MKSAAVKKITPILFAQEIEPCIQFWTERMSFQKTAEVPEGDKIGFALLEKDGLELMYQSYASVEKDNAATAQAARKGPTFLYVDVDDLNTMLAAAKGAEIVMPMRSTFYGAREFGIKDPVGHYIIFAQQGVAQQQ
ncbi:MAG TPA: VOC family protein [Candidatus Angelobacter sp.]|nr:VOC family protein [Candidatus Angelobacter sp.]